MSDNYHSYQLLLAKAAQLYEKHEVGRPEPFNIFSVLRKEKDEVYLHSRFLYELLKYRTESRTRENLKDFLQHVGVENFGLCDTQIDWERCFERLNEKGEWELNRIDVLITNVEKKAVIIENKIEHGDGDEQLEKYYKTMENLGYRDIYLLYLTLDGHDPLDSSVGDLDRRLIKLISYEHLIPWLECCQKRACGEPALRESVAQYLQLVRKLTGTDSRGKYMEDLKKLCLQDNNFVLIRDLINAMLEAGAKLLWDEIESELKSEIPDLPDKDEECSSKGLYYQLSEATSLEVGVGGFNNPHRIWFGVGCSKEKNEDKYDMLKEALDEGVSDGESDNEYPWWRYADRNLNLKNPTREDFELLSNNVERQKYGKEIVEYLKLVLEVLEDIAMVNAIEEGAKTGLASREQVFKILRGQE